MEQHTFRHNLDPPLPRLPTEAPATPMPPQESIIDHIENAVTKPFTTLLKLIAGSTAQTAYEVESLRKAFEAQERARLAATKDRGFAIMQISYNPANGVQVVDFGGNRGDTGDGAFGTGVRAQRVRAFSMATVPGATATTGADGSVIYFALHRGLVVSGANPPDNYQGLLSVGGKVQKFESSQGMEAMSVWSKSPFKAVLYLTAGAKDELPDLT